MGLSLFGEGSVDSGEEPVSLDLRLTSGQPGWLSGLALPSAQGLILETRDRVPRRAPCMEPACVSACVSASLSLSLSVCVSLMNG